MCPLIFLQRMNDYAVYYNDPEAIQSNLYSKKSNDGVINMGLNVSFKRSSQFQQIPEGHYGAASLLGTGFATKMNILENVGGFRFKSLVEDEYEELTIQLHDGSIRFIPDAYVVNENYSKLSQAKRGLTRWSRGSCECFLRMIIPSLLRLVAHPFQIKSWHIFCRINSLSKAQSLILLWINWCLLLLNNHIDVTINLDSRILWIIGILNLIMSLNTIIVENLYVLLRDYTLWQTIIIVLKAYIFQMLYQLINVWAVLTWFKKQWIVLEHGKAK